MVIDVHVQTVFVTGGSTGLGKEIAKAVAVLGEQTIVIIRNTAALIQDSGAHVTIFARRQQPLDEAKVEILDARAHDGQEVNVVSVDLSDAVDEAFRAQPRLPDIVYCSAGGCPTQCGFLKDISPQDLESCMRNNYFTAAYPSQAILRIWTESDKKVEGAKTQLHRRIVFINSVGALLGLPGYTAYTPSKTAVRALADTLRMEVLQYSSAVAKYTIHCAFPSNIHTESFVEEQKHKPQLTKEMEGTAGDAAALAKKLPSAKKVADYIVSQIDTSDFAICDSIESSALFANMVGPSPKRGFGVVDSLLGVLVQFIIWPLQRRQWDSMCRKHEG
ncbi:hypothetical protein OPT61_g7697 [Boeremia exigua]|uniref:Uncharacterized protein n=1 Tax=Boeremia exigua TaxID=749465 RepID=A0ACC2I1H8_9PLEO|nr:hypothetical protein OPT61_g7697 [Boeremia exigua]